MTASTNYMRLAVSMLALQVLAACQTTPEVTTSMTERDPRVSGIVVVRSYQDEFKIDGKDVPVAVEYAWDYQRAIAIERVSDPQGKLVSLTDKPDLTLNLTDSEKAYALELARSHPELKAQMETADHLYGGFSYREISDPDCSSGTRCVHVVASTRAAAGDGWRKLVHAIVDVQKGVVVHPHFAAGDVEPFDTSELNAKGH